MTLPRVVLVDDVEELRILLRAVLTRSGEFEVVGEAANGREGVELTRELQPDLVVLDLSMPVMDGLEALPEIHIASPTTRVVVLSGFERDRVVHAALQQGAVAYLEKGVPPAEVVATCLRAVGRHPSAESHRS